MNHLDEGPGGMPQASGEGRQTVARGADPADRVEEDEYQGETSFTTGVPGVVSLFAYGAEKDMPIVQYSSQDRGFVYFRPGDDIAETERAIDFRGDGDDMPAAGGSRHLALMDAPDIKHFRRLRYLT